MADSIRLRVSRYRPETDSEPQWQEYDVPLRKEWTVLDGLNHVKNEVDTTLSFRWSCRMGICGSCGMTVDGEPKLTCATFLSDYAPGPVTVEPLANFPVIRDLVVDLTDFMQKLPRVKPWIIRRKTTDMSSPTWSTSRRPGSWTPTSSSACASTACSATPPARSTGSTRSSSARPPSRSPSATTSTRGISGIAQRLDVLIEHDGIWGCTFVGECTRVCPKHVDPASAIQRYKLKAALQTVKAFLLPRGAR